MPVWKGAAYVSTTTGGLLGATRWFMVTTENNNGTGDRAGWEGNAGGSIALRYKSGTTGLTPPPDADNIIIEARLADGSTLIQLHNGSPPNNSPINLDLTSLGDGGADRCGEIELYIHASAENLLGDYTIDSQNTAGPGSISAWARGLVRSNALVTAITASAYPAGSTFAYGAAAAETFTLTAAHTLPFVATGTQQARIDALTAALATQVAGSAQAFNGADTVQQFTADNSFNDGAETYGARFSPVGNSFITPDSGAVTWTTFIDDGAVVQDGETVTRAAFFNVNPQILGGAATLSKALHNLGDLATIAFGVTNARGESLTRSLTLQLIDSGAGLVQSGADTGPTYNIDRTLQPADDADFDFTGAQWSYAVAQADVDTNPSANAYRVSNKYRLGSAVGLNDLAVVTDFELYNNDGEIVNFDFFLSNADGSALVSATGVSISVLNSADLAVEAVVPFDTDGTGAIDGAYATDAAHVAANDATGTDKRLTAARAGNTTDNSDAEWFVSSLYLIDVHTQISGTLVPDDFPTQESTETDRGVILGDIFYTWVHVEGIRNDGREIDTSGNAVTVTIRDPSGGITDTFLLDTGPDASNGSRSGWTPRLDILPAAPAGNWNYEGSVAFQGSSATTSELRVYITPLTSNLFILATSPVLMRPGQDFQFTIRCEKDGAETDPETVPVWRLLSGATLAEISNGELLSVVSSLPEINGSRYTVLQSDLTALPLPPGRYVVFFEAQLNGNDMKQQVEFRIAPVQINPVLSKLGGIGPP